MNKLFFILGFLLPLSTYFNDTVAGFFQDLGGGLWILFSDLGIYLYPVYLSIFFIPILLIISLLGTKLKPGLGAKDIFFKLLYGFITSSVIFVIFALLAISQFRFTQ